MADFNLRLSFQTVHKNANKYSGAQITRKQNSQSFTIPKVPFLSQLFILYVKMTHLTQSSSFQKEFSVSLQFRVRCAPLCIPNLVTGRTLIFGPHSHKIHFLLILSENLSSPGGGLIFHSCTRLTDARFKIFLHRVHAKVATIANRAKEGQKVRSCTWKL